MTLRKLIQEQGASEKGQALVLFALGLVAFCGLVGLSIDVGRIVYTRTELQKVADAAALAGGQDLPDTAESFDAATAFVSSNIDTPTQANITFEQTNSPNDTIVVTTSRSVSYTFMKVLGFSGTSVSATAKVRAGAYIGGSGILPWGFIASNDPTSTLLQNSCFDGFDSQGLPTFHQNQLCTVKQGAGTNSGGDFGALALDQTGAETYRNNIKNGSNGTYKKGDLVPPETGDMVGPTSQGIKDRLNNPPPEGCPGNDRSDVLIQNADGTVSIRPGCEESYRIGVIPVVDQIDDPQPSTILGFAFVFIHGTQGGGGNLQVKVEFVEFVTELPNGIYAGTDENGATAVKLVE